MNAARGARILFVALAASSSFASASDLIDAWQSARAHDPAYAAARAQWQAGQTKTRQARALSLPEVSVTGSVGVAASERNTTGAQFSAPGFGSSNEATFKTKIDGGPATNLAIVAQQPIYNVERRINARQLEREATLADAQLRSAEQELILRTAQAYFAVLLADETLATLRAQKEASARALDIAKERFEAGATPVTDRDEAQARFDEIVTQEIVAENDLAMKRVTLRDITGGEVARLNRIAADTPLDRYTPKDVAEWLERAAQSNPLIEMQDLGRKIAEDEVDKFRALVSPSVDLYARLNDERMQGSSGYSTTRITSNMAAVGVQITIPIFTGGMRSAKRDEAAALAQKAQYDAATLRQEVLRQTQTAWLASHSGVARVRAHEQALRSAQSRLNATETGQEVGARTMLDLMNAQSDFYQAERNLAQARYQLLMDRLRLAASAGQLPESALREVNAALTQR